MCGCQKTTYVCQCQHKERKIERCSIYQLREEGSCWSVCLPHCQPQVRRYRLHRVCKSCEDYFRIKYGRNYYTKYVQLFLDYKESMGWAKTAIDPQTVPVETLLKRQSAPAHLNSQSDFRGHFKRGQPFQVSQPMIISLPDISEDPGTSHEPRSDKRDVSKVSGRNVKIPLYIDASLFAVRTSEDYSGDDYFSSGYRSGDSDASICHGQARAIMPSPQPKYSSATWPRTHHTIAPELAHLAPPGQQDVLPFRNLSMKQPIPSHFSIKHQTAIQHTTDSASGDRILRKLSKAAKDMSVPNTEYFDYEGVYVPRLITPPKGKRKTRMPSSSSPIPLVTITTPDHKSPDHNDNDTSRPFSYNNSTSEIGIALAFSAVPEPYIPLGRGSLDYESDNIKNSKNSKNGVAKKKKKTPSPPSSTYFLVAQPDKNSPTGSSIRVKRSRSQESVTVPPPQRLEGVLIPPAADCPHNDNNDQTQKEGKEERNSCALCRGAFFKERGLPSHDYVREDECRSATLSGPMPMPAVTGGEEFSSWCASVSPPVLVSVHLPQRRYSCAVQSCYCNDNAGEEEEKCPSCQERERITRELNITWI